MPNIWSCDAAWFEKLKNEQPKVIVAVWDRESESDKVNEWLEKLQKFEDEGTPVFVCDKSCPGIVEKLGAKEGGETIVYAKGIEKGRLLHPSEDIEGSLSKVKELAG